MSKTLRTAIAVSLLLATAVVMLAFAFPRQQSRLLTVEQRRNAPVIITSVKIGDTGVTPNARFNTSPTWTEDLRITIRNDSEQPISYADVSIAIDDHSRRTSVLYAEYVFGKLEGSTERLAPGDTVTLTKANVTIGDPTTPGLIRVTPRRVRWNGDTSREWFSGFEQYLDPDNPRVYRVEPTPQVRYQFPKGYKQDPKLVKARLSVVDHCDRVFTGTSPVECRVCTTIHQPVDYCRALTVNSTPCSPETYTCDMLDWSNVVVCGPSGTCTFASCNGSTADVKVTGPACDQPDTPILIDVEGDGFQLTDRQGGVVFSYDGARSVATAWTAVGSDDSFLCKDRNGNGRCDDGTELFSNYSPQPASFAPNGFRTLALEDTDNDGKVSDSELSDLLLWNDANHNGESDTGEVFSLASVELTSLDTRYTSSRRKDQFGNWLRYRANGKMDGRTVQVYDVFFAT